MVYERLYEARRMPENRDQTRQFAINSAISMLRRAGVKDPGQRLADETPVVFEKDARERADHLRSEYKRLWPDLNDIPISQFTGSAVSYKDERADTVLGFLGIWLGPPNVIQIAREEWQKHNLPLGVKVKNFLVELEEKTLDQLGLTEAEKTKIADFELPTRYTNSLSSMTYRNKTDVYEYYEVRRLFRAFMDHDGLPSVNEAGSLSMRTEDEVKTRTKLGTKGMGEIRRALNNLGLAFATA
jgi:hypothetical protein